MDFTEKDILFLQSRGIRSLEIERQLDLLKHGSQYPKILRSAKSGEGILLWTSTESDFYQDEFRKEAKNFSMVKFVPASGAATRMFSFLNDFLNENKDSELADLFFARLSEFPFYGLIPDKEMVDKKKTLKFLLGEKGLRYNHLPKGLIPFHKNRQEIFTAFESHLHESIRFAETGICHLNNHFTIAAEAEGEFRQVMDDFNEKSKHESGKVHFSIQEKMTDTVAILGNGEILRDEKGEIIFRPGGHGSLLKNLGALEEDLIFIRNIDNVVSPDSNSEYVLIHRIMAGMLIHHLKIIYGIQKKVENGIMPDDEERNFLKTIFHYSGKEEANSIHDFVFRPIRICGMVKNEGEPGGGPFWIDEKNGGVSLQIIESSQVNPNDHHQGEIFKSSTHFNPVDICCSIKNHRGEKYDLMRFRNEEYSFLATKSQSGKTFTVLEHPGLWNGSMHHWLTIFVEIPVSVFNPAKTVNDLLRESHQK